MSRKHGRNQAGDSLSGPVVDGLRAVREPRWDVVYPDLVVPGGGRRFSVRSGRPIDDHDGRTPRIRLRPNAP